MLTHCIICFNLAPGTGTTSTGPEELKQFFKLLGRYFGEDDDGGNEDEESGSGGAQLSSFGGVPHRMPCCEECSKIVESFSQLYRQMKVIQLQLDWKVRQLGSIMYGSQRAPRVKVVRESAKQLGIGDAEIEEAINFKRELIQKCGQKNRRSYPRLKLRRCPYTKKLSGPDSSGMNDDDDPPSPVTGIEDESMAGTGFPTWESAGDGYPYQDQEIGPGDDYEDRKVKPEVDQPHPDDNFEASGSEYDGGDYVTDSIRDGGRSSKKEVASLSTKTAKKSISRSKVHKRRPKPKSPRNNFNAQLPLPPGLGQPITFNPASGRYRCGYCPNEYMFKTGAILHTRNFHLDLTALAEGLKIPKPSRQKVRIHNKRCLTCSKSLPTYASRVLHANSGECSKVFRSRRKGLTGSDSGHPPPTPSTVDEWAGQNDSRPSVKTEATDSDMAADQFILPDDLDDEAEPSPSPPTTFMTSDPLSELLLCVRFKCSDPSCGKGFSGERQLLDHQRTAHGGARCLCQYCGKTFAFASPKYKHERLSCKMKGNDDMVLKTD